MRGMSFKFAAGLLILLAGPATADEIPVRAFHVVLSHDDPKIDRVDALKFRGSSTSGPAIPGSAACPV